MAAPHARPAFDADVRRLKREHREEFLTTLREKFIPACEAYAHDPTRAWPASLRVTSVRGAGGILEMTAMTESFASPDGRATFEVVTVEGEARIRWRRVGDHGVFRNP